MLAGFLLVAAVPALIVLVAIAIPVLWPFFRRRRLLRDSGLIRHRIRAFTSAHAEEADGRKVAAGMTDVELLWAQYLPDHTAVAKNHIRHELNARGYPDLDIAQWLPPPEQVTVPNYYRSWPDAGRYFQLIALKRLTIRAYRWTLVASMILLVGAWIADNHFGLPANDLDLSIAAETPYFGSTARAALFWWAQHLGLYGLMTMYLCVILIGIALNRLSMRILLLRPFGEKRMTKPLRRFVVRSLGGMGNIFTLSDRGYRPSFVLSVLLLIPLQGLELLLMLVVSPLLRNSQRIASVKKERSYRRLHKRLLLRYRLSTVGLLSGGQAINIRSTDSWWKTCILCLMHSSQIIVVDLSTVKSGTDWELRQLAARRLLPKCLFVIGAMYQESVESVLSNYFAPGDRPTVYAYDAKGNLANGGPLNLQLERMVKATLSQEDCATASSSLISGAQPPLVTTPRQDAPTNEGSRARWAIGVLILMVGVGIAFEVWRSFAVSGEAPLKPSIAAEIPETGAQTVSADAVAQSPDRSRQEAPAETPGTSPVADNISAAPASEVRTAPRLDAETIPAAAPVGWPRRTTNSGSSTGPHASSRRVPARTYDLSGAVSSKQSCSTEDCEETQDLIFNRREAIIGDMCHGWDPAAHRGVKPAGLEVNAICDHKIGGGGECFLQIDRASCVVDRQ
jgi:hypothetical protein